MRTLKSLFIVENRGLYEWNVNCCVVICNFPSYISVSSFNWTEVLYDVLTTAGNKHWLRMNRTLSRGVRWTAKRGFIDGFAYHVWGSLPAWADVALIHYIKSRSGFCRENLLGEATEMQTEKVQVIIRQTADKRGLSLRLVADIKPRLPDWDTTLVKRFVYNTIIFVSSSRSQFIRCPEYSIIIVGHSKEVPRKAPRVRTKGITLIDSRKPNGTERFWIHLSPSKWDE